MSLGSFASVRACSVTLPSIRRSQYPWIAQAVRSYQILPFLLKGYQHAITKRSQYSWLISHGNHRIGCSYFSEVLKNSQVPVNGMFRSSYDLKSYLLNTLQKVLL